MIITGAGSHVWQEGEWHLINRLVWGQPEIDQMNKVLLADWFGGNGEANKEFERKAKEYLGLKYFQTTNSGSAAIEIAVQTMIQSGKWKRGDKILHPILTFPTSIASAIMAGLVPVFVDSDPGTYVISTEGIKDAFRKFPDIAGAIIPALLGNSPHISVLRECLGDKPLILDSCDVIGTKWAGQEIGTLGDIGCYSFYGSHHLSTAGVGGGLGTNNDDYYRTAKSMAFWGRDFSTDGRDLETNFIKRYSYQYIGLDAQMSALQAAFGIAQWDRLPEFLGQRESLFLRILKLFLPHQEYFILPERVSDVVDVSWFCFPITVKKNALFTREDFVKYLLEHNVEIRPIMASNLLDNKPYRDIEHETVGEFTNANEVALRGFFIPSCPMSKEQADHYLEILAGFLEKY